MPGFVSSLYTYPWDLDDEDLDVALRRIRRLTGVNELMVAASYHVSTYFLPHNPRRPIYWGEDGAIYFVPDRRFFRSGRLAPRVSETASRDFFERMQAAVVSAEMGFGVWLVYLYNHYLAERFREYARTDVFGNPALGQLSIAPMPVVQYVHELTRYVLDRFKPSAVHVESLSRMPWNYGFRGPKVLSAIAPRHQFILGIDFHRDFIESYGRDEGNAVQKLLADWLRPRLARLPTEEDNQPVDDIWVQTAFDGRMRAYLEHCQRKTTDVWKAIAGLIHEKGAQVQSGLVTPESTWRTDLQESCNSHLDRVTVRPGLNSFQIERIKSQLPLTARLLVSTQPGSLTEAAPLRAEVHAAKNAGCEGATFYNYGLLREEQLAFIGQALESL